MTKLVYLAEPIDLAQGRIAAANHAEANLLHTGRYAIYRPATAWKVGTAKPDGRLDQANREVLDRCDVLVAIVLKGVPSVGVPMEIEAAQRSGTPVVCLTDHHRSWALTGRPGIHITDDPEKLVGLVSMALAQAAQPATPPVAHRGYPLLVKTLPEHIDPGCFEDIMPMRGYDDDAGLDLFVTRPATVPAGGYATLSCGIAVELPYWAWGLILGRSSAMAKRRLLVPPSVIDTGWRGPLGVGVLNVGTEPAEVTVGDRVGQLIIMNNFTRQVTPLPTEGLSDHARGHNGFGSTGT